MEITCLQQRAFERGGKAGQLVWVIQVREEAIHKQDKKWSRYQVVSLYGQRGQRLKKATPYDGLDVMRAQCLALDLIIKRQKEGYTEISAPSTLTQEDVFSAQRFDPQGQSSNQDDLFQALG